MAVGQFAAHEIADRIAIHDLIWSFADAINRNDAAAFVGLWHPDGHWHAAAPANLDAQGHVALDGLFRRLMGLWTMFHQSASAGPVTLKGDRATVSTYVQEIGIAKAGPDLRATDRFDDLLVRTDAGWRFLNRSFHPLYAD